MTRIFLVRHGEVAGNAGDKPAFVGWSDLPLNSRGERQAELVARYLELEKVDAVYASDLQRAKNTAEAIAQKHNLPVRVDADLREVNYGAWEGLSESDLLAEYSAQWSARQNDPWNVAAVEGESYEQMWNRFLPKWHQLVENHAGETAVLVAHNGLIRMLLCFLLGAPFENFKRIHVSNGGVSRVEIGASGVLLRSVNETNHLTNHSKDIL